MEILAHRGDWKSLAEKNTLAAAQRAFENGFGMETDIRDYGGRLVISHDPADAGSLPAENLFALYQKYTQAGTLALNVKADGIQKLLYGLLEKYNIRQYFVFDMSVPEQVLYRQTGMNYYTRHSEIESVCTLYDRAVGVWLDSFYAQDWLTGSMIWQHLLAGKCVGIISPELHGKDYRKTWEMLKRNDFAAQDAVKLCTDFPEQAKEFFYA